jgi:hypothetical protein
MSKKGFKKTVLKNRVVAIPTIRVKGEDGKEVQLYRIVKP